ncbi:MAG: hypothetical protein IJ341_01805 [Bacteroidales bacterium]|nr:hypothetical protein [Bacteroidales bacterium]
MNNRVNSSVLYLFDIEVANLIAKSRNISHIDALRLFLNSETYKMLVDENMKLWHFSFLAVFDMWENEVATGEPRNSFYLRGDEIE